MMDSSVKNLEEFEYDKHNWLYRQKTQVRPKRRSEGYLLFRGGHGGYGGGYVPPPPDRLVPFASAVWGGTRKISNIRVPPYHWGATQKAYL